MVYTCCVPGCRTGYKSSKSSEKIPLFRFPHDDGIKELWIKAIPRKNWILSYTHRVCSKHFEQEDFLIQSIDKAAVVVEHVPLENCIACVQKQMLCLVFFQIHLLT